MFAEPTEEQKNCEHKKVFSNIVLTSYPPQYPWICEKCGFEGRDRGSLPKGPTYAQIKNKFSKENQEMLKKVDAVLEEERRK